MKSEIILKYNYYWDDYLSVGKKIRLCASTLNSIFELTPNTYGIGMPREVIFPRKIMLVITDQKPQGDDHVSSIYPFQHVHDGSRHHPLYASTSIYLQQIFREYQKLYAWLEVEYEDA